ncbi:MAG: ATP-binding protein [Gammaproteobacteria bacterium]|nr:ATP-binding protein [Gammaproteobacteria bacterium]
MPSLHNKPYLTRHLEPALAAALSDTPVVCLLGPRQCGKSTLAKHLQPKRAYFTLDDENVLNLALNDPQGFIAELPEEVTIDEIQRAPELTLAIKRSVDENRLPGRFLLTGSANLLQLPRLSDSLAGRMDCIYLRPFTELEKESRTGNFLRQWLTDGIRTELKPSQTPRASELPRRMIEGGYPEAFQRQPDRARRWQRQYIQSIIERDIHDISQIKGGQDIARLLEYLSYQTAQLLNVSSISVELGHTRSTVERYLGLLERLFLTQRLPAWHRNSAKRLVKAPKLHFIDSGIAGALCGLTAEHWIKERSRFGHLLESFVLQQVTAQAGCLEEDLCMWHYRDKDKVEVDIVITHGTKVWGLEIKASKTVNASDSNGLKRLRNQAGKSFQSGIILYDGDSVLPVAKEPLIHAVPISRLWQA